MLGAVLAATTAHAEEPSDRSVVCETRLMLADLDGLLAGAEQAWAELDTDGFHQQADALATRIRCLAAPPTTASVGRVHAVFGLERFSTGDETGARRALAAWRATDAGAVFAPELVPPGHPIRALLASTTLDDDRSVELVPPRQGTLWIDGRPSRERPTGRPALVQLVGTDGLTAWTTWAPPDQTLPDYLRKRGPTTRARKRTVAILWATTSALAATAAGLGGAAATGKARFESPGGVSDLQELDALRARVNTLGWSAYATGGAMIGVGIASLVETVR